MSKTKTFTEYLNFLHLFPKYLIESPLNRSFSDQLFPNILNQNLPVYSHCWFICTQRRVSGHATCVWARASGVRGRAGGGGVWRASGSHEPPQSLRVTNLLFRFQESRKFPSSEFLQNLNSRRKKTLNVLRPKLRKEIRLNCKKLTAAIWFI